jgi:hypothetical protein
MTLVAGPPLPLDAGGKSACGLPRRRPIMQHQSWQNASSSQPKEAIMQFDRETLKWFFRAFVVTSALFLVAAAVLMPQLSRAQGTGNGEQQRVAVSANFSTQRSDDPSGRINLPAPQATEAATNEDSGSGQPSEVLSPAEAKAREGRRRAATGDVGGQGYSSPLVIPAADFTNDGNTPSGFFFPFVGGYLESDGVIHTCHMAAAYVPDGATIDSIYASVVDNDATKHLYFRLYRVDNFSGTVTQMAEMITTDAAASPDIVILDGGAITSPNVIYPDYSYYVGGCVDSTQTRIFSVRIYYH